MELSALFELQRRHAQSLPQGRPLGWRVDKLKSLERAIKDNESEIIRALIGDFGKPPFETLLTEVYTVLSELRFTRRHLKKWTTHRRVKTPFVLWGNRSEIWYEPRGTVLVIGPWNYPFQLLMSPLIGAIAAGNSVILKPSEYTPEVSSMVQKIVSTIFSSEEVSVVTGGAETSEALTALPFDHIFFTGSTPVGKKVAEAAAKNLSSYTLELGGKSPAIVLPDADVLKAAQSIAWGKWVNAGQTCVAPDFVWVSQRQSEALMEALTQTFNEFDRLSGDSGNPTYAQIIQLRHFDRLESLKNEAVSQGAKIVYQGECRRELRLLKPCILKTVPPNSRLMQEEIFGPLLPILVYDDLKEVVDACRSKPVPLALYLFGERAACAQLAERLPSGGTCINHTLIHLASPYLPFGGKGESGLGNYHGFASFRAFSHERSVMIQTQGFLARWLYPPYSPFKLQLLKKLRAVM